MHARMNSNSKWLIHLWEIYATEQQFRKHFGVEISIARMLFCRINSIFIVIICSTCTTSAINYTMNWRIFFFFFFFPPESDSALVFASLQMDGSRDIDRLTNCEKPLRNIRRNAIITESTRISLWMRAGYNWMSRKMAALPAIFHRNRFRHLRGSGEVIEVLGLSFAKCAPDFSTSRDIRYYIDRQP